MTLSVARKYKVELISFYLFFVCLIVHLFCILIHQPHNDDLYVNRLVMDYVTKIPLHGNQ